LFFQALGYSVFLCKTGVGGALRVVAGCEYDEVVLV